ncbi:MAG TPA: NYN domain-containing protein [Mycobacteriales bacterium]|nr:NYN domain-containing protein [Mycobacteriales bacterium]
MQWPTTTERIALFLDYENLAIGARDGLGVSPFDFGPVADALAERGRVVVRRAYADWSYFDADRRLLARAHVELIEIPQHITFPEVDSADDHAFRLLIDVVRELQASGAPPQLSGLNNQLRKRLPDFSEKRYGFNSFLSFAKAARARDLITMEWDDDVGDYLLRVSG